MKSVMGVIRLMEFKVGQRVKIKTWLDIERFRDVVYFIEKIDNNIITIKRITEPGFGAELYFEIGSNYCDEVLILAEPICPVCNEEVEIEDKKVKKHNHNNELCYGSFTPYEQI